MSSAAAREPDRLESASTRTSARVADLFERHGRMVFAICRTMLRDPHEAEDATQQTFLSAHRALLAGATVRDTGAWIATIARNECRARISAGMRSPLPTADEDLAELPHRADAVEQSLRAGELVDALARLPERQREAVVLRYVHGLRYGEIATALGLSRPATEALLFRARRAMRIRLRHASAAAVVLPVSIRDELASALPGFEPQGGSVASAGIASGLLAKLASTPTAAKVAAAALAASTVGTVGVVQSERPAHDHGDAALGAGGVQAMPGPDAAGGGAAGVDRRAGGISPVGLLRIGGRTVTPAPLAAAEGARGSRSSDDGPGTGRAHDAAHEDGVRGSSPSAGPSGTAEPIEHAGPGDADQEHTSSGPGSGSEPDPTPEVERVSTGSSRDSAGRSPEDSGPSSPDAVDGHSGDSETLVAPAPDTSSSGSSGSGGSSGVDGSSGDSGSADAGSDGSGS